LLWILGTARGPDNSGCEELDGPAERPDWPFTARPRCALGIAAAIPLHNEQYRPSRHKGRPNPASTHTLAAYYRLSPYWQNFNETQTKEVGSEASATGEGFVAGQAAHQMFGANRAFLLRAYVMECKPVVSPPAKHASNWPQREHAEQAVKRTQFRLFEFKGIAPWALVPYPEHPRDPVGPRPVRKIHLIGSPGLAARVLPSAAPSHELEFESSQERSERMLPVASAIHESAAP
jgi:hypothetical protein